MVLPSGGVFQAVDCDAGVGLFQCEQFLLRRDVPDLDEPMCDGQSLAVRAERQTAGKFVKLPGGRGA